MLKFLIDKEKEKRRKKNNKQFPIFTNHSVLGHDRCSLYENNPLTRSQRLSMVGTVSKRGTYRSCAPYEGSQTVGEAEERDGGTCGQGVIYNIINEQLKRMVRKYIYMYLHINL